MHSEVGGYRPCDIKVVTASDIDERKVGKDISEAIFEPLDWHQRLLRGTPRGGRPGAARDTQGGVAELCSHFGWWRTLTDKLNCV